MPTSNLPPCPIVTAYEKVDLAPHLDFVQNTERMEHALRLLKSVDLYEIMYRVRKGLVVKGYIAMPHNGEKLPCLIHLRGGSGDFGRLDARQLLWQVVAYAGDGYMVITTQYPGVEGGEGKDTFGGKDDIASIQKLREILKYIPQADTNRIGVKGHSRGGLMAYMLLRESSWIRAAVIAGAPTDQVRMGKEREGWREHQIKMFGASKNELLRRSPIKWVRELPKKTPLLILHGSSDKRVDAGQSMDMSRALLDAKVPHRFVLFEGADHGITEFRAEYHDMTRLWFRRYLVSDRILPNLKLHGL